MSKIFSLESRHSSRKLLGIAVLVLAGLLFSVTQQQAKAAPGSQTGPTAWTVLVGGQGKIEQGEYGPVSAWQFMRFYPETITINAGDTINFKLNSAEPHTVTFPAPGEQGPELLMPATEGSQQMIFNPLAVMPQGQATYDGTVLAGSGQLGGEAQFPTEYQLTFTKPGTYEYICAFHPMMKGTVIVQPAGSAYPQTQEQIDAEAARQLEADTQAAQKIEPGLADGATRPGPNGTAIHQIKIGYGDGVMAWMRFGPTDLTINAGDTVEWTQADMETPHTVTFTSGGTEPEMVIPEPQTNGPPTLLVNPQVLEPAGGTTYHGEGYFNSGFIWGTETPFPGPRTYSLTFDTPGTYEYICVLHDMMGMNGHITVQAANAPAGSPGANAPAELPVTGGAVSSGQSNIIWLTVLGIVLVAAGIFLAFFKRSRTSV